MKANQKNAITIGIVMSMTVNFACFAEEAENEKDVGIETIIITAQRTSAKSLQETPLAVTAFSESMLEDTNFESLKDIEHLTPSLEINGSGNAYIRGVGTNLNFPGSDPSVATFVDGVYYSNTRGVLSDLIGIERVEVLKGPQGTLYGRNAAGGVISVITRKPDNEVNGRFNIEYGSDQRRRFGGGISGPLVDDSLYASFSLSTTERDGHTKNVYQSPTSQECFCDANNPPSKFNGEDSMAYRGALRYTPSDDLEINFAIDYSRDDAIILPKTMYSTTEGANLEGFVWGPQGVATVIADDFEVSSNMAHQFNHMEQSGFSARVDYAISEKLSLISISARRELDSDLRRDTDNADIDTTGSNIAVQQEQTSQEFQLTYKTDNINMIGGIYYFVEDFSQDAIIELPFIGAIAFGDSTFAGRFLSPSETDAIAAFFQLDYQFSEKLNLTAGIRYSEDTKKIDRLTTFSFSGTVVQTALNSKDEASFDAVTPKFGLNYNIDDDMMIYANITRGFKSGGFNFSDANRAFDPEYLWAYEAGLKADWLDGRFRSNFSTFYYDYTDLQVQAFVLADATQGTGVAIFNAADADVSGIEMELTAKPTEDLTITFSGTYLDATYKEFLTARDNGPSAGIPVDVQGNRLNSAPELAYSFTAQYEKEVGDNVVATLRGEYSWRDDQFRNFFNDPSYGEEAYGLANLYLSLGALDNQWKVTLYARNLTDEVYSLSAENFAETGVAKYFEQGRNFGVILSSNF